jgi:hypothetical protein
MLASRNARSPLIGNPSPPSGPKRCRRDNDTAATGVGGNPYPDGLDHERAELHAAEAAVHISMVPEKFIAENMVPGTTDGNTQAAFEGKIREDVVG